MKKTILFSLAAALVAGAAAAAPAPAKAGPPSCGDRAQWMFPYDNRARKAYKRGCKDRRAAWNDSRKAWKKARKRAWRYTY